MFHVEVLHVVQVTLTYRSPLLLFWINNWLCDLGKVVCVLILNCHFFNLMIQLNDDGLFERHIILIFKSLWAYGLTSFQSVPECLPKVSYAEPDKKNCAAAVLHLKPAPISYLL